MVHICSKTNCGDCNCSYCPGCHNGCPQCGKGQFAIKTTNTENKYSEKVVI